MTISIKLNFLAHSSAQNYWFYVRHLSQTFCYFWMSFYWRKRWICCHSEWIFRNPQYIVVISIRKKLESFAVLEPAIELFVFTSSWVVLQWFSRAIESEGGDLLRRKRQFLLYNFRKNFFLTLDRLRLCFLSEFLTYIVDESIKSVVSDHDFVFLSLNMLNKGELTSQ